MKATEIQARRDQILTLLESRKTMRVSELVNILKISDETVRKDLSQLSTQGLVKKEFGKVSLLVAPTLAPVHQRTTVNASFKAAIANEALELLPDRPSTIALDQGSSVAQLANLIANRTRDTIITNSLLAMIALQNSHQQIYVTGGKYNVTDMSFQGERPSRMYTDSLFDFCFLGSSGVAGRNGLCSSSFADAEMKRQMIKNSHVSIVLLDATKFQQSSLVQVADWNQVDYVVTNLSPTNPLYVEINQQTHLVSVM
ncbi:DeoR/GlpR family DNA-binding transcription regulator [Lactiplantibacillus sp. DA1]|uniref:DeoR/GlpR family DNA-binding transcription regulator n=1 Tax=Lactiplantibacillus sp. DA1 TaxID=3079857 RepID=UPI00292A6242|nr:DeoR/GlpR family DNA-binding transcription regulator [Lactiplantibacillus sp. DA1]MDV0431716.1 DeoR/GlpR family DNA-binding transcription regulator [Lactiplantibacillus sp. DA1]